MSRLRLTILLTLIVLAGFLLRFAYLQEIEDNPDFAAPLVDADYHDFMARALLSGDATPPPGCDDPRLDSTPYFRPPGYPFFLALAYRLAGLDYLSPRLVQMALGLLNVLLAFVLARRYFGEPAALIFAFFMSIYSMIIYFEGELLPPVLLVSLGLALVWSLGRWLESPGVPAAILSGVLLGLFALVRPNILLFAPLAAIWAFRVVAGARGRGRAFLLTALFAAAAVATIAPATIRNCVKANDFVLISSNGGINLFIGNNEKADGFVAQEISDLGLFNTCYDYPGIVRNVEKKLGRPLKHSEVSRYFAGEAIDHVRADPGRAFLLAVRKALLFWGPVEISHNKEIGCEVAHSAVLRNIPGNFAAVLTLALAGLAFLALRWRREKKDTGASLSGPWKRKEMTLLVLLFVLAYFVSFLPFFVSARYRVPVIPFLLLFAASGVTGIAALVAARNYRKLAVAAVSVVAVYALLSINVYGITPSEGEWHLARGAALERKGALGDAVREYGRAVALLPGDGIARYNLANSLCRAGRFDEAVRHCDEALRQGRKIGGSDLLLCLRGKALTELGSLREAQASFAEAVALNGDNGAAHNGLGIVLLKGGNLPQAIESFSRALEIDPADAEAHRNLGVAFATAGRKQDAIRHFEEALRLRPGYPGLRDVVERLKR